MLFLNHGNGLSAILGMNFVNVFKAWHFLLASVTSELYQHISALPYFAYRSYLKERNEDLYLRETRFVVPIHPTPSVSMSIRVGKANY